MARLLARPLFVTLLALSWLFAAAPARAAVTITFWSHDLGHSFPHAFFTLRGVPDAGGDPVDANYGFTARKVSPALLWGTVAGEMQIATPEYIGSSDARFSVVLSDAQYGRMLSLIDAWDGKSGNGDYNLNRRNCVHFVKEAARIAGLAGLDQPKLMKRPRSYLTAVAAANAGAIIPVELRGTAYLASLSPLPTTTSAPVVAAKPAATPMLVVAGPVVAPASTR